MLVRADDHNETDANSVMEDNVVSVKSKSFAEIMKDVIVYIEVKSGRDNRTEAIKSVVSGFGVKVNDRLIR